MLPMLKLYLFHQVNIPLVHWKMILTLGYAICKLQEDFILIKTITYHWFRMAIWSEWLWCWRIPGRFKWYLESWNCRPPFKNNESKQEVNAINSIVRFKHLILGCYLFTHPRKLPEYAHDQQEITCALLQGKPELTYWYIETNYHPNHLPNTKKSNMKLRLSQIKWRNIKK